jgi:hypothetical protein
MQEMPAKPLAAAMIPRTLTKCARAKINAASISFAMRFRLVACGMASRTQSVMQSATQSFTAAHITL